MGDSATPALDLDRPDVQAISDWLIAQGLTKGDFETLFGGFCDRLAEAGLALWRGHVAMRTLHPDIESMGFTWRRGGGVESLAFARKNVNNPEWRRSPLYYMIETRTDTLRRRLGGSDAVLDFPFLEELRAEGATDYLAQMIAFDVARIEDRLTGVIATWASDGPGGFSDSDLAVLNRLAPRLALSLKVILSDQIATNVLNTYLGPAVGRRVLRGEIDRGAVEIIPAVIWYADLRGFTAMSDRTPRDELTEMLNGYFECMVDPVVSRGGQVLKFLGDGLLATFSMADRPHDVPCSHALAAADEALRRVGDLNAARHAASKPVMDLDIALHLGDVLYGNVGAADRLDFTVIGPAVNEASRIETLCTPLRRHLLISEAFAKAASACAGRLESVGRHELRGVRGAQELFTLKDLGA